MSVTKPDADLPTVLVLPGLNGSGPRHWQSIWERRHPEYRRVEQASWTEPRLGDWALALEREVRAATGPVVLEAHGLAPAWGARVLDAGRAGHLDVESGHGRWPEGEALLGEIVRVAGRAAIAPGSLAHAAVPAHAAAHAGPGGGP